jgi:hypothetical protein
MDHTSRFMVMTLKTAVCIAAIGCFAGAAPAIAKKVRVVCRPMQGGDTHTATGRRRNGNRRAFVLPVRLKRVTVKRKQRSAATLPQQLRQLGDVHRDPSRLILREQLGGEFAVKKRTPARYALGVAVCRLS